ncbi:MAG: proton-conducting transporter membrane subunit [Aggregatilineales bacterium]
MENFPQLVPLIILFPAIGAFINLFWGYRLGEKGVAVVGTVAAALSFVIAVLLYAYLAGSNYEAAIINPPLLDGWIRLPSGSVEIPWQMRVDTLSVTMMLFVTGIGSLIHVYSIGYMHGDERFHRFFAYLNMFLAFMLVLVTGNNFLMLFVGWEGVGLCSFLLIGFWFDKTRGVGWRNSNAARKAFIVNRVGDFGLMTAIFLIFWTFGTLDFYRPGEIANPKAGYHSAYDDHGAGAMDDHASASVVSAPVEDESLVSAEPVFTNNDHIPMEQLGVFGQLERMLEEGGHEVSFGPFALPIETMIVLITLLMLLGAAGKSAQIPLFVWLPDAMAGPTPVSALIHAATMVTAGVYMMVRSNVFFYEAEFTSLIVTLIGAGTALVGGFIALSQWDIKRVLAYSTVSQLGFMVAAVGVGAYSAAIFHLVTHAFFKALLFLGSGSVIHGVEHGHHQVSHGVKHDERDQEAVEHHDEATPHLEDEFDPQDMRNMGGLRHKMPITYWTYLAGTLALIGIFPFAGFWSKDEILADSWIVGFIGNQISGYIALGLLLLTAGFTAFYMWRQVSLIFFGRARTEAAEHAHESPPTMTIPLVILAFLSVFVGFINTPANVLGLDGIFGVHRFTDWLEHSVLHAHAGEFQPLLAIGVMVLALFAIGLASNIYSRRSPVIRGRDPLELSPSARRIWLFSHVRMYWDETYDRFIVKPFERTAVFLADTVDWTFLHDYFHDTVIYKGFNAVARWLANPVDLGIIDGVVNGIGRLTSGIANWMRGQQVGYVRVYAITLLLGVVFVVIVLLLPLLQRG